MPLGYIQTNIVDNALKNILPDRKFGLYQSYLTVLDRFGTVGSLSNSFYLAHNKSSHRSSLAPISSVSSSVCVKMISVEKFSRGLRGSRVVERSIKRRSGPHQRRNLQGSLGRRKLGLDRRHARATVSRESTVHSYTGPSPAAMMIVC